MNTLLLLLYGLLSDGNHLTEATTFWYNQHFYNDSSTGCDYDNDPANVPDCCSAANKCGPIQGHCDNDAECLDGLACGSGMYAHGAVNVCYPRDWAIIDHENCVEYGVNYHYNDIGYFDDMMTKEACFELCLTYPPWECAGAMWNSPDVGSHPAHEDYGCWLKYKLDNRLTNGQTGKFTFHRNCSKFFLLWLIKEQTGKAATVLPA